jgi:hypothetical protein
MNTTNPAPVVQGKKQAAPVQPSAKVAAAGKKGTAQ